jgi:ribA/ribD-fused uncharacterized protein
MPVATEDKDYTMFDSDSLLSNGGFTPFFHGGLEFKTMTHFLEYHKAMKFKNPNLAKTILQTPTPAQSQKLYEDLTYTQLSEWYTQVDKLALQGLRCKFNQNPTLLASLRKTNGSSLVMCGPDDGFWGVGLNRQDASRVGQKRWPGQNKIGKLLDTLRADYLSRESDVEARI